MACKSEALVARGPFSEGKWALEPVTLRELRDDEVLVEMVASGICHTDLHCGNTAVDAGVPGVYYPRVLGHEGSGYVVKTGSAVENVRAGDAVLLSFSYCGNCYVCKSGPPSHCINFFDINFMGEPVFEGGIGGRFFGQSSLARHSVVSDKCVVNVAGLGLTKDDLKLLAPLGCGLQTGSGTVINVAKAGPDDYVTVAGMGGVGLAAVIAAKNRKCKAVIGLDRVDSRLTLAKSLGATHVINTSNLAMDEIVAKIKEASEGLGSTISIDTTAFPALVSAQVDATRYMGKVIQVGTGMPNANLALHMQTFMVSGKQYFGAVQGHSKTSEYIPQMIQWWRDGDFPIEKLVTFFDHQDYARALEVMGSGEAIKPVIVWKRQMGERGREQEISGLPQRQGSSAGVMSSFVSACHLRKDYVSDLEQRLKKVEHLLQRHDDLLTGHLSACTPVEQSSYHPLHGVSLPSREAHHSNDGIEIDASVIDSEESESEAEARTDGLAITFVDERAAAYFGESSNIGFVRYLLGAVSAIWGVKQPEGPQLSKGDNTEGKRRAMLSSEHSPLGALPTTPQSLATSSRLPAVSDMETMINRYFNTMGLLFPFLHESTFRQTYEAFKASGFNKVRQTWLGELNLIFAIASNINRKQGKTSKQCFQESLVYYRRAMSLCGASCLRSVSLDIVQFLLLQALYLQGTPQAGEAWSVHGLLVRSAVALGLHSDKVGRQLDENVQEMRNRTWHTIYCLDTVLSATFGRPCAIPPAHMTVRLPQPWHVPETAQLGNTPEVAQIATDFLSISVQLYQIMGLSIEAQYNGNIGTEQNEDEVSMLQTASTLRQKLRRWAETLPPEFSLLPSSSPDLKHSSRMNKLRAITTVRYLSKINGRHDAELPYTTQLAMAEAFECLSSAEETIGMAASVFGGGPVEDSNLGVWFFTLYYVFTAALMVCGGMLCARHSHRLNAQTVVAEGRANLVKAADALENLDNSNPLVKRCVTYIRYLSQLQDYRSDSDLSEPPSDDANAFTQMEGLDFMGMVDLLDDHSGLGPYLAAELFDSSTFDSLALPP
ncbi:hypothetical protein PWT90_01205 [Aphanocladium album]|nr:hypothetical protein PWT90_01205 [Aphanocladium album]